MARLGSSVEVRTRLSASDGAKKVLVIGASGLVGSAAVRHFAELPGWDVVGVSRRVPANLGPHARRTKHVSVDLTDTQDCVEVFSEMSDVTHLVYAAVYEKSDVVEGWRARDQMETNRSMLINVFEPLEKAAKGLQHVSLMQGTKAYGVHCLWPQEWFSTPAREDEPRHPHENFYWLQQDYLIDKQQGKPWSWTIWRPQLIFGDPIGSNLSTISVIGVYAALEREASRPLSYPGGAPYPLESCDVDLLAHAIAWATTTEASHNEIFNITNGDVYVWQNVWPVIAEAVGMPVGEPRSQSMAEELPKREAEWAHIVEHHNLAAPASIREFIGGSAGLADYSFAYGMETSPPPVLVSTVKLRQAGFHEHMHTDEMFRKWLHRLQELRYIPPPEA